MSKTTVPVKFEDRVKRLPKLSKMLREWETQNRPRLIMLHLFGDNLKNLEKWMEMAYQLAAPESLGQQMDFYLDDVWAAYIFNPDDFNFFRGDESCSADAVPLIYGISASRDVYFFGDLAGPQKVNLETLGEFCKAVINGNMKEPIFGNSQFEEIDLTNWNELIYTKDEDIAVCFYNSQQNGTELNDCLMTNLERVGNHLRQEPVRLYKMNLRGSPAPKKFQMESTPALFFLQRSQKQNPKLCKHELGFGSMLKFIAENSSEELNYYNRRGHRKIHAELLADMKSFLKL